MRVLQTALTVAAATTFVGCAQQILSAAQNECTAFGFAPGTNEYASCVQQQYAAGHARLQQGFANAQRSFGQNSFEPSASGTGFLRKSYISGMNRICVYDRMGSAYALTVGAAEMCPMTVP
jgi:hypothetical protein